LDQTPCTCCSKPVSLSLYIDGIESKSCVWCSREAGQHVFHPLAAFGLWHTPRDGRRPYMQSECVVAFRRRAGDPSGEVEAETCDAARARGASLRSSREPQIAELLAESAQAAAEVLAAEHPLGRQCVSCLELTPTKPKLQAPVKTAAKTRLIPIAKGEPREYSMSDRYELGDAIRHPKFGLGVACVVEARLVVVQFEEREVRLAHCKHINKEAA
jgi:hypothetical protein